MTLHDLDRVADFFTRFHAHFAPLFGRAEAQRRSEQYLRGLLVQQADRRNAENIAEVIPGATARPLQRFLTEAPWSHRAVLATLQQFLGPHPSRCRPKANWPSRCCNAPSWTKVELIGWLHEMQEHNERVTRAHSKRRAWNQGKPNTS